MSATPDLSICIVNWNGRDLLRQLLQSIAKAGDTPSHEIIVVDNGSTDGSQELVATQFPHATLIRNQRNAGFAAANNQAVAHAKGRLLFFLNNDTIVRPGSLAKLVSFLDAHAECVAVGPRLIGADGQPQHTGRNLPTLAALLHRIAFLKWTRLFARAYRRYRRGGFDPNRSMAVPQLAASALLVRREQFEAGGRWDEGFEFGVEDVDLCARLGRLGSIYYLHEAEIDHIGRVSSRANRPFIYRGYECGYVRYLGKHQGRATAFFYKTVVTLDMPLRVALAGVQTILDRLLGRRERAARTHEVFVSAARFMLCGLPRFWRS